MSSENKSLAAPIPPYLRVPSITDPKLRSIPPLESFQVLEGNERTVKSYQIRIQRPKFSWLLLLLAIIFVTPALTGFTMIYQSLPHVEKVREPVYRPDESSKETSMFPGPIDQPPAAKPSDNISPPSPPNFDSSPTTPGEHRDLPSDSEPRVVVPLADRSRYAIDADGRPHAETHLLGFATPDAPDTEYEEHYERIRGESTNAWILLVFFGIVAIGATVAGFIVFRKRGHTFLYLTNRRLIVLELAEGIWGKDQTILNFNMRDICGFQLLAQRGLRKLLGILLLREKRTFYLSIATRTNCNVAIGAVSSRRSRFEPGGDAVTLCGELDAQVLALRNALGS